MLTFLLTGTNSRGTRETIRVQAASANEAWQNMEAQGYSDIVLHTDDMGAVAVSSMSNSHHSVVTAADELQLRSASRGRYFLLVLYKMYTSSKWLLAVVALLFIGRVWAGYPIEEFLIVCLLVLALSIVIAAWNTFFNKVRKYDAMLEAFHWGQTQNVLDMIPALRGSVPDFELDIRVACTLARLGRMDEGLSLLKRFESSEDVPPWMYHARLAEVYAIVGKYDVALECRRRALAAKPDDLTMAIDLASDLFRAEVDLDQARELLDWATEQHLSDIAQTFILLIKGLDALCARQYPDALMQFRDGEQRWRSLAIANASARALLDEIRAYEAIALAEDGKRDEAAQIFAEVRPRFDATKNVQILDRYARAIGR